MQSVCFDFMLTFDNGLVVFNGANALMLILQYKDAIFEFWKKRPILPTRQPAS